MSNVLRVGQLSDTHFREPGAEPEGTHGYDTSEAFDAVLDHLSARDDLDLVVVTGDVADHGRAEQYEIAAEALGRIRTPVAVCPGNHDFDEPFRTAFGTSISVPRVTKHGPWTFVYADSNAGAMSPDADGRLVDPPGEHRIHLNGTLGEAESSWLRSVLDAHDSEYVFVWLHHPPDADVPLAHDAAYTSEWEAVVADRPKVRGFGAGHTHVPSTYTFQGCPVFVAPSLKNNFDLDASTWLPPGYRTYEFAADGAVTSELHLVDDERWPRRPFGRTLRSLFMGEISYNELAEIIAERSG